MKIENYKEKLPKSVLDFIDICSEEDIPLVLYGSAVSDFFTHHKPNDYDFYVFATVDEFFKKVATKYGLNLEKYGDYVLFTSGIYYFFTHDNIKVDLNFNTSNKSKLYLRDRRGVVTISSLLMDLKNESIIDKCHALRDIEKKTIKCYNIKKAVKSYASIKCFLAYFSYLHGKHEQFSLDDGQLEFIVDYLSDTKNYDYYEKFKWQKVTTLVRIFSYSVAGIKNIAKYWEQTNITTFFFPDLDQKIVLNVLADLSIPSIDKLYRIDNMSNGRVLNEMRELALDIPSDYFKCINLEAKRILLSIIDNDSNEK